jgi:uncharacterized protein YpuA (DUF1002 family)
MGRPTFSSEPIGAALLLITAIAFFVIPPASAFPSSKLARPPAAAPAPGYGTSTAEQQAEQMISECDQKADHAKVSEAQRMDFVRQCLADLANNRS